MLSKSKLVFVAGVLAVAFSFLFARALPAAQEKGHQPATGGAAAEKTGGGEHGAATAGGGAAEKAEPPNPLKAEPTLAIWTLVVFLCLLGVLTKFAWKPLMHALHEREKHLEHVLHETERARNESEMLLFEHRKQMAQAADEVRSLLEKARQDGQMTAEQIVKAAQSEAEQTKQRATRDIGAARDQALAEIWEKTADMAVSVAGRVLSKELTEADHRRLIAAAVSELPAKPGANGHGGKA
jgi:F-type H+-transporting ATPase subunit b